DLEAAGEDDHAVLEVQVVEAADQRDGLARPVLQLLDVRRGAGAAGRGLLLEDLLQLLVAGLGRAAAGGAEEQQGQGRSQVTHSRDYTPRERRGNKNVVSPYWTC